MPEFFLQPNLGNKKHQCDKDSQTIFHDRSAKKEKDAKGEINSSLRRLSPLRPLRETQPNGPEVK